MTKRPSSKQIAHGIADYCNSTKKELLNKMDFITHDETGGYLGFKRTQGAKILVVAHIDYVGTGHVSNITSNKVISSALDDRAGVYAALELLPAWGIKADILLTDNEELGLSSIKSISSIMLHRYNWIVELDRQGTDVVSYGFADEANQYLRKHFNMGVGSYSDICELEDTCPVIAFNLGVGYYFQHTEKCMIVISDLRSQLNRLLNFYNEFGDQLLDRQYFEEEEVRDKEFNLDLDLDFNWYNGEQL